MPSPIRRSTLLASRRSRGREPSSVWLGNGSGRRCETQRAHRNPPPILLGADPGLFVFANLDGDSLADLAVIDREPNEGTGGAIMRTFRGLGEENLLR